MRVYVFQAELICEPCGGGVRAVLDANGKRPADLSDETTWDSGEYPKGPYPDGGGEADTPQHCGRCGVSLENAVIV